MLYVDKYRPKDLSELHYHPHLTEQIESLVRVQLGLLRTHTEVTGRLRGRSTCSFLWTDRGGKEDADRVSIESIVWTWRTQGMCRNLFLFQRN